MHNEATKNIIEIILQEGPIPFDKFMQEALYNPKYGYYMSTKDKIGASGDFITAPEISPMFGACIAAQIDDYINKNTSDIEILELGPGNGTLALSILTNLKQKDACIKYNMLELSPSLKQQQLITNAQYVDKIKHLDSLPENFNGIIIANEVIDAMPVSRFTIGKHLQEEFIDYCNNELTFKNINSNNKDLIAQVSAIDTLMPPGYSSEINLALPSWINSISNCLSKGLILLIDYGYNQSEYYHVERHGGTLKCFYKMKAHNNPLVNIGKQDITAHVDFTSAALSAQQYGLDIVGYAEQAHFLFNLGLIDIAQMSYEKHPLDTAKELKLLTMPSEMGSLCKVLGLTKNVSQPELAGFYNYNKVESLF
jgi:SAM-dependent MidA family methyltransferase